MPVGVTVGLTQSLVKAFEGEGSVEICAALEKGQLGTNLSVFIETDSGNAVQIIRFHLSLIYTNSRFDIVIRQIEGMK